METSAKELLIGGLILVAVLLVGAYVLGKLRLLSASDRSSSQDLLTNFREMHSQGVLSDQEFRTIKTTLATKIQHEISQDETNG